MKTTIHQQQFSAAYPDLWAAINAKAAEARLRRKLRRRKKNA